MNFRIILELYKSANRALGGIKAKFCKTGGMNFDLFT